MYNGRIIKLIFTMPIVDRLCFSLYFGVSSGLRSFFNAPTLGLVKVSTTNKITSTWIIHYCHLFIYLLLINYCPIPSVLLYILIFNRNGVDKMTWKENDVQTKWRGKPANENNFMLGVVIILATLAFKWEMGLGNKRITNFLCRHQ